MILSGKRTNLIRWLSVAFLILNCSWLFAPVLNSTFQIGPNLVSEYEALNAPYSEWFRIFDALAALCLLGGIAIYKKSLLKLYGKLAYGLLVCVPILLLIDDATAVSCGVGNYICISVHSPAQFIHNIESLILGATLLLASASLALKQHKLVWVPVIQAINIIVALLAHHLLPQYLFGLQALYIIVQTYWLWRVVFDEAWQNEFNHKVASKIRLLVALLASFSGLVSIFTAILHYKVNEVLGDLLLVGSTAWLDQHAIIVGLILLFIARNLLRGSRRAYFITVIITLFELVDYSGLEPLSIGVFVYGLLLTLLVISRRSFDQQHSTPRLVKRLRLALIGVIIIAAVVTASSVGFKALHAKVWKRSAFTAGRVVQRTLLLEVSTNPKDPLKARIFGQVLTATGVFLYGWLLTGLFLPSLIERRHPYELATQRKRIEQLLNMHSRSSEDYFKLWPRDKQYWFSANEKACVAYKVSGSYALALNSPIASSSYQKTAMTQFADYARSKGWQAVWLMTDHDYAEQYGEAGLSSLTIGASAIIDIQQFAHSTVKNKWWRWARNKAFKSGLSYHKLEPPHNMKLMQDLETVSNSWLGHNGRVERGFAMGYFEKSELETHVIHCLKDSADNIVAFADQLPTFNRNSRFTIDMMRFMPEHEKSMALLLSEIIIDAAKHKEFITFDLGFVPLAHASSAGANVLKAIFKPIFSTKGLRQFKNKFEPSWQTNYLIWNGTVVDLPAIATSLQRAMTIKEDPSERY